MTRDEQRDILKFIDRAVRGDPDSPARPMDLEADAIIRAMFVRIPEAAYRVTMLAMAQARELESLSARLAPPDREAGRGWFGWLFVKRPPPPRQSEMHVLERTLNKV